ncbi:MAG: hypothetical protein Q8N00_00385 [Nitrospirota bacterium]|nr:hypothetical protein [Nitrospirota bacterium]MDP3598221.1 hypothetical protein [Nitrospirota bacterium]
MGYADPDRLAQQLSARKLREWQAYAELEPFGPPAGFWRAGLIASVVANVNRTKKSQQAFSAEDFMPRTMVTEAEKDDAPDVGASVLRAFQDLATLQQSKGRS